MKRKPIQRIKEEYKLDMNEYVMVIREEKICKNGIADKRKEEPKLFNKFNGRKIMNYMSTQIK